LWALLGAISLFGSVALLRQNDPRVNPLAFIYVAYAFHEDDHDLSPPSLARSMQSLFLWSLIAVLCGVLGVRCRLRRCVCCFGCCSLCTAVMAIWFVINYCFVGIVLLSSASSCSRGVLASEGFPCHPEMFEEWCAAAFPNLPLNKCLGGTWAHFASVGVSQLVVLCPLAAAACAGVTSASRFYRATREVAVVQTPLVESGIGMSERAPQPAAEP